MEAYLETRRNSVREYAHKIALCDALTTKMWTMLHGMKLTWQERIKNLVVESDSKVLINRTSQEFENDHSFPTLI